MTAQMNEGEMRASVVQIIALIKELRASVAQTTTAPMVSSLDNPQIIASTTKDNWPYADINRPERQPIISALENILNIASNINYRWPCANGNCPERQPVISSFDQTPNIATTAKDNWPYANINNSVWQPMGNYFENNQKIASMTEEYWPHANMNTPEPQPFGNTRVSTQLQETGVRFGSAMNQQRSSYDSGARRYAGINEEIIRVPIAKSMVSSYQDIENIASATKDNWPYANTDILGRQGLNDTRISTQHQGTGVGADKMIEQPGPMQDSEASHDSYSSHGSGSARTQDLATSQRIENSQNRLDSQGKPSDPNDSRATSVGTVIPVWALKRGSRGAVRSVASSRAQPKQEE